jgi:uncharacterized membrane protein
MRKLISYIPFIIVLICNILALYMFAITGDMSMIVLSVFGVFGQVLTTQKVIES